MSARPLINTRRSFTLSVWLNYGLSGESGTAVSEPGPDGSSFSLGIQTTTLGPQSLAGKPYLVWFYPKAQTPGCTAEGRGIRDRFADCRSENNGN